MQCGGGFLQKLMDDFWVYDKGKGSSAMKIMILLVYSEGSSMSAKSLMLPSSFVFS